VSECDLLFNPTARLQYFSINDCMIAADSVVDAPSLLPLLIIIIIIIITNDNVYGVVIVTQSLREFTRFI